MAVALRPVTATPAAVTPLARMAADVRKGLLHKPPYLPSKYFYDDTGSALFELITSQPEYYQTRTEERLLAEVIEDVIERARAEEIIELGSGAGRKIRTVLDAQRRAGRPLALTFFDINRAFVSGSLHRLSAQYPGIDLKGIVGDFTHDLAVLGRGGNRLAVLFAGTIGNLHPEEMAWFLERLAAQLLPGDCFLVGVDLVKDPRVLEAAYNDAQGVTAAFNVNILDHINRELNADFDTSRFMHVAFWNPRRQWIEMRLRAIAPSRVRIQDSWLDLRFATGDSVRTEISCKYSRDTFADRLTMTPFAIEQWYEDGERLFALALLRRMR